MPQPVAVPIQLALDALLTPEPEGGYSCAVPALPGCHSEGDTLEEAVEAIRDAAAAWLAAAHDHAVAEAARTEAA